VGGRLMRRAGVGVDHFVAVHLAQPQGLGRHRGAYPAAVLRHRFGTIAGAQPQVEGVVRSDARPAGARGAEVVHAWPSRTRDDRPTVYQAFHAKVSWTSDISAGTPASKLTSPAPPGSSKCRARACSIWRVAPASGLPPYSVSASRGCPRLARCTRIWWVRPVSSRHSTSVTRAPPSAQPSRRGSKCVIAGLGAM